jgi:Raf kinase inhibitor-like YbhB/YbcL family protein
MRSRVVTMFSIVLIVAFAVSISMAAAAQAPAGGGPPAAGAPRGGGPGGAPGGAQRGGGGRGGPGMALTSTAWSDGGEIPLKHAGGAGGQSISPPLSWTNVPMGTVEFVLIMNDPEPVQPALSVSGDILHWMVAKIPASTTSLPENAGAANSTLLPAGAVQVQSFRGPGAPAAGPRHHYTLTLYALNAPLDATAIANRAAAMAAMDGKVLGRAIFGGRFMQAPAP